MSHLQAVEREAELSRAERRVVDAAKKWDAGIHSDINLRMGLREAVQNLRRLESTAVDGGCK